MDKKIIRTKIRNALKEMPENIYKESSCNIKKKLLKEPSIIEGNTIAITISNKPEVETLGIIESLWKMNKTVVVPKCNTGRRTMDFYAIENFNQLESVYMNLLEPIPELTVHIKPENIDCIIVPGIVFDMKGYRIGYGGGYYDRYLKGYNGNLVSLCFELQLVDLVPVEAHDLPVDTIITEKRKIECLRNRKEHM